MRSRHVKRTVELRRAGTASYREPVLAGGSSWGRLNVALLQTLRSTLDHTTTHMAAVPRNLRFLFGWPESDLTEVWGMAQTAPEDRQSTGEADGRSALRGGFGPEVRSRL